MRSAAEAVVGERCRRPRLLDAGRSSTAWLVESTSGGWVVRVPIPNSGRLLSYRSEARLGDLLGGAGHPVVPWTVVDVRDTVCSVGPYLAGEPVEYGTEFSAGFASSLGRLLAHTHELPADGFGPLVDRADRLQGQADTIEAGVIGRWFHAPIWPFDGTSLSDHPINAVVTPADLEMIAALRSAMLAAATQYLGVTHSDLHREHLLRDGDGGLAAVLDFGDAFIGSAAWDFALLRWYYGGANADRVAAGHPLGVDISAAARHLAVAVGLYKLAKNPTDRAVVERLQQALDDVRS